MVAKLTMTDGEASLSKPELLFEAQARFGVFDVSPDGQRFLMVSTGDYQRPNRLNLVLNWHEELERLVPTEQ